MKKVLSIAMALLLVFAPTAVSFAFLEKGSDPERYYCKQTTENYDREIREPKYGKIVAWIDIDVMFEYDGTVANIFSVEDNSIAHPDYRISGYAIQVENDEVLISYIVVPLGYGNSINFDRAIAAYAGGELV